LGDDLPLVRRWFSQYRVQGGKNRTFDVLREFDNEAAALAAEAAALAAEYPVFVL